MAVQLHPLALELWPTAVAPFSLNPLAWALGPMATQSAFRAAAYEPIAIELLPFPFGIAPIATAQYPKALGYSPTAVEPNPLAFARSPTAVAFP